ncbi:MAG: TIGR04282 family arsenosugar biosynthesis glycosyltransferase [Gammaproteobacteria bacterium]
MNGGAAIFVKTPGLSPVKTRLARGFGREVAEQWHRLAAAAVAAVLRQAPGLTVYWAVAEPAAQAAHAWPDLPLLQQGPGELGERMGRVHAALLERHDFALLLGADTPQVGPAELIEATDWLAAREARLVMGPARDGGFWLIGANCNPAAADWTQSPCSRADTARGFHAAMERHGGWRFLPTLTDVDEPGDLGPMLVELDRLQQPAPEQVRLAEWTRAISSTTRRLVPEGDA